MVTYEMVVLHNLGRGIFHSYAPGDALVEATRLRAQAVTPRAAAEVAYRVTTVDRPELLPRYLHSHHDEVSRYQQRGNRALALGDVIVVADRLGRSTAWACELLGFSLLPDLPRYTPDDPGASQSAAYCATAAERRASSA